MSKSRIFLSMLTLVWMAVFLTTALQADPSKNKGKSGKAKSEQRADKDHYSADIDLSVMISIGDARKLASSHGLTGGKPLPPGIRKNLARGKPMPPGIQKTRMPGAFINQLPSYNGYEWEQAGTDLVLVASGSLEISTVLKGVFD